MDDIARKRVEANVRRWQDPRINHKNPDHVVAYLLCKQTNENATSGTGTCSVGFPKDAPRGLLETAPGLVRDHEAARGATLAERVGSD